MTKSKEFEKAQLDREILTLVTSMQRFSPDFWGKLSRLLNIAYPESQGEKIDMLKMVVEKCRKQEGGK